MKRPHNMTFLLCDNCKPQIIGNGIARIITSRNMLEMVIPSR